MELYCDTIHLHFDIKQSIIKAINTDQWTTSYQACLASEGQMKKAINHAFWSEAQACRLPEVAESTDEFLEVHCVAWTLAIGMVILIKHSHCPWVSTTTVALPITHLLMLINTAQSIPHYQVPYCHSRVHRDTLLYVVAAIDGCNNINSWHTAQQHAWELNMYTAHVWSTAMLASCVQPQHVQPYLRYLSTVPGWTWISARALFIDYFHVPCITPRLPI